MSDEDHDEVRRGIEHHFERTYRLLADELGGEPSDYDLDADEMDAWTTEEGDERDDHHTGADRRDE